MLHPASKDFMDQSSTISRKIERMRNLLNMTEKFALHLQTLKNKCADNHDHDELMEVFFFLRHLDANRFIDKKVSVYLSN